MDRKENRFVLLRLFLSLKEGRSLAGKDLAELLGISPSLINMIERGERAPSKKVAAKLEEKYGISKEWFLTGEGIAPWEERDYQELLDRFAEIEQQIKKGKSKSKDDKMIAGFAALSLLLKTPQNKLVDYFIEAGKNPAFRKLLFTSLNSGLLETIEELKRANQRIKELESQLADDRKKTKSDSN